MTSTAPQPQTALERMAIALNISQAEMLDREMQGAKKLAETVGVTGNAILTSANCAVRTLYSGIDVLKITGVVLPSRTQELLKTPTDLGLPYGLGPREINTLLEKAKFQTKDVASRQWKPTEAGAKYAEIIDVTPATNKKTFVQQLKWYEGVMRDPVMMQLLQNIAAARNQMLFDLTTQVQIAKIPDPVPMSSVENTVEKEKPPFFTAEPEEKDED